MEQSGRPHLLSEVFGAGSYVLATVLQVSGIQAPRGLIVGLSILGFILMSAPAWIYFGAKPKRKWLRYPIVVAVAGVFAWIIFAAPGHSPLPAPTVAPVAPVATASPIPAKRASAAKSKPALAQLPPLDAARIHRGEESRPKNQMFPPTSSYDPVRHVLVAMEWNRESRAEVTEWDLGRHEWTRKSPNAGPEALALLSSCSGPRTLLYDPRRDRKVFVLFLACGGGTGEDGKEAVLEWNQATGEWVVLHEPDGDDPFCSQARVIFDAHLKKFLMIARCPHGKEDSPISVFEWNDGWDRGAGRWDTKQPSNVRGWPLVRSNSTAAYDEAKGLIVMFGGLVTDTGKVVSETWQFNGVRWTQAIEPTAPEAQWPAPRQSAVMAYDPVRGGVILLGGIDRAGMALDDAWLWNPSTKEWLPLVFTEHPRPKMLSWSTSSLVRLDKSFALWDGQGKAVPQELWLLR